MWAIILHGGAKEIEPEEEAAHRTGCLRALDAGRAVLASGGLSVEAVEATIRQLEADPTFNAGYGSALNADGEVEMCSALMEGQQLNIGAVSIIKGVQHPISVARKMLFDEPILIGGEGARRYAASKGIGLCEPQDLVARSADQQSGKTGTHDTVGCVALDMHGDLACGTSTGGLEGSPPGRIGDSPQPGCGFYADNRWGAVVYSGDGEQIARVTLAAKTMQAFENRQREPVRAVLTQVLAIGGEAGGISITPTGEIGWDHNSREFAVAYASDKGSRPHVYLRKSEERQ